ncbi:hypothetical protein K438DRAFT_1970069 [Mycena galopus ATCC 62051]|nr:hypothetical protein K438DRAFT_1970069 [Mycena galopus ATCC 62051]
MAVLATLQVVMHLSITILDLDIVRLGIEGEVWPAAPAVELTHVYVRLCAIKAFLLVTNNIVTDSLFIYRCFLVWGRNVRVVVVPILMLLTATGLGYLSTYKFGLTASTFIDDRIVFVVVLLTNVLLMILTAGRIWWIRRDAAIVLSSAHVQKYDTVIAIILESGAINCLSIILFLVFDSLSENSTASEEIFLSALPQIMNIAPTLIIVRVGLGRSVEYAKTGHHQQPLPLTRARIPVDDREGGSSFVIDIGAVSECAATQEREFR